MKRSLAAFCFTMSIVLGATLPASAQATQDGAKSAIAKWRACADAAAARFAQSTESAPVVARLAALACVAEKRQAAQAVAGEDGERFADEYVDTIERRYTDKLSVDVIEMRLRKK